VGGGVPAAPEAAAAAVTARSTSVHRMTAMEEERRPGGVAVESAKCRRDEEWKNGWEQRDRRRQRSPRHTPHRCVGKSDDRWAGAGNGVSWKHRPLWTFTRRGPIELSMDCRWAEKDRRWAFSCPSVIPSKSWPR